MILLDFLARLVSALLWVEYIAMFLRALLSWLPLDEGNPIIAFLTLITEPIIIPVRTLLMRFRFVQECPFDLSFMATFMLLVLLQSILPVI